MDYNKLRKELGFYNGDLEHSGNIIETQISYMRHMNQLRKYPNFVASDLLLFAIAIIEVDDGLEGSTGVEGFAEHLRNMAHHLEVRVKRAKLAPVRDDEEEAC